MYVNEADDNWYSIDDAHPLNQDQWCYSIVFNKDGNIIISCSGKFIKVWKFQGGNMTYEKKKYVIKAHKKDINTLSYSKQQNMFISGSDDNTIKIWTLNANNTFQQSQEIITQSWPLSSLLKQDDSQLFAGLWNGNLLIFNKNGNEYKLQKEIQSHKSQIYSISLNDSQDTLLTLGWDKQIKIYLPDGNIWQETSNVILDKNGFRASFISDDQIIYQPLESGSTQFFQFNKNKKMIYNQNIALNIGVAKEDKAFFPIQWNKQKGLFTIKLEKKLYVIKKENDNKCQIVKTFDFSDERTFGAVTPNFDYVIVWNKKVKGYEKQAI
ncbi:unnamed protein product [Paramecium primaurelia]|uniref:WD40-repeat-containing domain n=1 Tax=Paramecium primaurelia TaxID=5886 RepID=A0A8S1Q8Y9_PARPR|nr:unnamed protein product [Paramecium primaurelia]